MDSLSKCIEMQQEMAEKILPAVNFSQYSVF